MPESDSPHERLAQPAGPSAVPGSPPSASSPGRRLSAAGRRLSAAGRRLPGWAAVIGTAVAVVIASLVVPAQWLGSITPGNALVDSGAVAVKRGSALTIADRVSIEGLEVFEPDGEILLTTVSVDSSVTVFEWLQSAFVDHIELRSREEVFGDRTPDEQREHNLELMQGSKEAAVVAALHHLGIDAVNETGIGIGYVIEDGPVAGLVEPGEVIVGLDGAEITSMESLREVLDNVEPGGDAEMLVEDHSSGRRRTVDFVYGSHPEGLAGGFIGVGDVVVRVMDLDLPFDIDIESGAIGGPSAGLAFTLTLIDLLTSGELTGGARVAATGTISRGGLVSAVGGVAQKAAAASLSDVDLFIVPIDTLDAALAAQTDTEIAGVADLDEALEALAGLGGDIDDLALELPEGELS